jgi:uncharacterized protein DUF4855
MRSFWYDQRPAWARPLLFCFPFVLLATACLSAGAGPSPRGQASDNKMAAAPPISTGSYLPPASSRAAGLSDIVLIYQGGTDRLPWTPEQFAPYVSARTSDGREHWLFDGFLFIEFRDNRGHMYSAGLNAKPARQEDWLWLIERNFAPGTGVPALDQAVNSAARRLGEPARPRQVILTIPEPLPDLTDWGSLNGRPVDFRQSEDRIAACRWHIETALAQWDALHPVHLKLAGFYWVAESSALDATILPQVAEIVHAHGLRFFWIPYWLAPGAGDWAKLGFDAAYQQPNHFFHPEIGDRRLDEACAFARRNQMGLEFECDNRVYQSPEVFRPRLYSYLRAFEAGGVREQAAMAYYEGGGVLLHLFNSSDARSRADYQAIADWVVARQLRLAPDIR